MLPFRKTTRIVAAMPALAAFCAAQTAPAPADPEVVRLEEFRVTAALEEFSDIARLDRTPVSFTEVTKSEITEALASRDIPFALQNAPSFYVTNTGGGAGDSRLSVRGFNQRNVSILINGVPTNDIENGWLYWSNWDGLGDVTSVIQLQRGLSAVTLPTQSIGGTLNIITDPAAATRGGSAKFEVGDEGFFKQTYVLNSGLLDERFAFTFGFVQKRGDGFVNGTWTEGRGYYLGASWQITPSHKMELFGIAAPQRHGQATFQQNIATYDANFARSLGYTDAQLAFFPEQGRRYSANVGPVSPTYNGQQFYWGGLHPRQNSDTINLSENYYTKPQVNLNWYAKFSDEVNLTTVIYYSGGRGGGAGTLGSFANSTRLPGVGPIGGSPFNWDAAIAANRSPGQLQSDGAYRSIGILRNSVNEQDQFGAIAKLNYSIGDWILTGGLDWRTAKIDHFREVRDLLGGDFFVPNTFQWQYYYDETTNVSTPVATNVRLRLGDKVDYYNTNNVDWLGQFVQAQYRKGPWSGFAVASYSTIQFELENHFVLNPDGSKRVLVSPKKDGYQVKGGAQYAFNKHWTAYANAGYVAKLPIFDAVIIDFDPGRYVADYNQERFHTVEAGVRYHSADGRLTGTLGFYRTKWNDRAATTTNESTVSTITYQRGIDALYQGMELEATFRPGRWLRLDLSASIGDWQYTADGTTETYNLTTDALISSGALSINGLRVGDAPQAQFAFGATVYPTTGLSLSLRGLRADRFWSNYNPEGRINDYAQSWQIPAFTKFDFHVNYRLPDLSRRIELSLFAHVLNVFDEVYVQDATDNWFTSSDPTRNNAAPPGSLPHSAQRAQVFMGAPRTAIVGVKASF